MKIFKKYIDLIHFVLAFLNILILIYGTIVILSVLVKSKDDLNHEETQPEIQYIEKIRYATEKEQIEHNREEVEMIAKVVYGESIGSSKTEQAAVIWCVLNRVDDNRFPNNITDVITQKNQFTGYHESNPVYEEYVELAKDVLTRWEIEGDLVGNVGRVLPKEYCWFRGINRENVFRDAYKEPYNTWGWSLESPYKED